MKLKVIVIFAVLVLVAARLLAFEAYDDFDGGISGQPVTTLSGWTNAPGDIPGIINNSQSFSQNNSVELPSPPGAPAAANSSMLIRGEQPYTYLFGSGNNPVMRIGSRILCDSTNQTVSMRGGGPSGDQWVVRFDGGDGCIKLNGIDSGVAFVTGVFAEVVLYYNQLNNTASLDYNGYRILNWVALGGAGSSQFDHVSFNRESAGAGRIYVDNFVLDTFPDSTVGWWRFDEGEDAAGEYHIADYIGRSIVRKSIYSAAKGSVAPLAATINDGHYDFRNGAAFAGPAVRSDAGMTVPITMADWTFEAVVKFNPGGDNFVLFEFGEEYGNGTTCSSISFDWNGTSHIMDCRLRDDAAHVTNLMRLYNLNTDIIPDGTMHHFAAVKTGDKLVAYLDYEAMSTNQLIALADGVYSFGTNSHVGVGEALSGAGLSDEHQIIDEIRLSNGALSVDKFLKPYFSEDSEGSGGLSAISLLLLGR